MSSGIDFSEYEDLAGEGGGGFSAKAATKPEDEFFHAVYISGQQRKNHLGEDEIPGKLQIRGLKSNLKEINMAIVHIKAVLVKTTRVGNKDNLECFSYQVGTPPWKGTSGNICGKNSTERAAFPYCSSCRSQLIIAGLYIDEITGKPFVVDGKPVYIFIRAKGIKYGNIANYLSDLAKRDDLEPIVTPVTEKSKKFEQEQVNHKRFIAKITVGKTSSAYGMKDVFNIEIGSKLSVDAVKNILNKSKETLEKFKEKFDWSRTKTGSSDYSQASNTPPVSDSQKFGDFDNQSSKPKKEAELSFEEVSF